MDAVIHQIIDHLVDHAVAFEGCLTRKRRADNVHPKVTLALTRVTGVLVTLIDDLEQFWRKSRLQPFADLINDSCRLISHGNTLRKGLTEVAL